MRVTDENDPFFLFNLSLGEPDFQGCGLHTCIYTVLYIMCTMNISVHVYTL